MDIQTEQKEFDYDTSEIILLKNVPGIDYVTWSEIEDFEDIFNINFDEENINQSVQKFFNIITKIPLPFTPIFPNSLIYRLFNNIERSYSDDDDYNTYLDFALRNEHTFRITESLFSKKHNLHDYTIGVCTTFKNIEYNFTFLFVIPHRENQRDTYAWPLVLDPLAGDLFILDMSIDFMSEKLSLQCVQDLLDGKKYYRVLQKEAIKLELYTISWQDINNGAILNLPNTTFVFEGDRFGMIGNRFDFEYLKERVQDFNTYKSIINQ